MTTTTTTIDLNDVPNLDAMNEDELLAFETKARQDRQTLQALINYAEAKRLAIECRLKGNIALAMKFEATAETVYNRLPMHAKW